MHRRFPIAVGDQYFVLDLSDLPSDEVAFSLPIFANCSEEQIYLDTYKITSYSGGTIIPSVNPESIAGAAAKGVFRTGITPVGSPGDDLRQYIVGAQGQGNVSGGGSSSGNHAKTWQKGDLIVFKVTAAAILDLEFNFLWYEIPNS